MSEIPMKQCSRKANCMNPLGSLLPATTEYFHRSKKTRDGYKSDCKICRNYQGRQYSYANGSEPMGRIYPDGTKRCPNCGQHKLPTLDNFYPNADGWGGLHSICIECHSSHGKKWYGVNQAWILARQREYILRNKTQRRAYEQRYYLLNKERLLEYTHKRYRDNPEHHKSRNQAWRARNPFKQREYCQRRRAREYAVEHTFTSQDWQYCLDWFNHTCPVCGKTEDFWTVLAQDHWMPVSLGGAYVKENIIPLCHGRKDGLGGCNREKSSNDPHIWLVRKVGTRKAKRILEYINTYFNQFALRATV